MTRTSLTIAARAPATRTVRVIRSPPLAGSQSPSGSSGIVHFAPRRFTVTGDGDAPPSPIPIGGSAPWPEVGLAPAGVPRVPDSEPPQAHRGTPRVGSVHRGRTQARTRSLRTAAESCTFLATPGAGSESRQLSELGGLLPGRRMRTDTTNAGRTGESQDDSESSLRIQSIGKFRSLLKFPITATAQRRRLSCSD
jgi:hypothetical protein